MATDQRELMALLEKYMRLWGLMTRYRHHFRREHRVSGDPLRGQGRVLALLAAHPEIGQRDLARALGMRSQTLGELLAKLERSGYIHRTPSQRDRRAMIVHLTAEGRAAAERIEGQHDALTDPFASLSGEERGQLSAILDKLIASLEDEMGDESAAEAWSFFGGFGGRPGWGPQGAAQRAGSPWDRGFPVGSSREDDEE